MPVIPFHSKLDVWRETGRGEECKKSLLSLSDICITCQLCLWKEEALKYVFI